WETAQTSSARRESGTTGLASSAAVPPARAKRPFDRLRVGSRDSQQDAGATVQLFAFQFLHQSVTVFSPLFVRSVTHVTDLAGHPMRGLPLTVGHSGKRRDGSIAIGTERMRAALLLEFRKKVIPGNVVLLSFP